MRRESHPPNTKLPSTRPGNRVKIPAIAVPAKAPIMLNLCARTFPRRIARIAQASVTNVTTDRTWIGLNPAPARISRIQNDDSAVAAISATHTRPVAL